MRCFQDPLLGVESKTNKISFKLKLPQPPNEIFLLLMWNKFQYPFQSRLMNFFITWKVNLIK